MRERLRLQERELRQRMAPLQRELTDLHEELAVLDTEQRRRERQRQIAERRQVREQVKEGEAPSLAQLLESPEVPEFGEPEFSQLTFLLATGGEVSLGYPGAKSPSLQMTDGKTVTSVSSLAEARRRFGDGWEVGVPARRGVRVHTPGTRLERLLAPEDCFVRAKPKPGAVAG